MSYKFDNEGKSSFSFVSLSAMFHGAILIALVMIPAFKMLPQGNKETVEIVTDVPKGAPDAGSPSIAPVEKPVEKPVEAAVPVPQKVAEPVIEKVAPPAKKPVVAKVAKVNKPAKAKTVIDATPTPVLDDDRIMEEIKQADAEAQQFAESFKNEEAKEDVVEEAAQTAAAAAIAKQEDKQAQEEKPQLPAPVVQTPKETMSEVKAAQEKVAPSTSEVPGNSTANMGSAEGTRSYLDLKQIPGNVPPQYPQAARRNGWQGEVMLSYIVTAQGAVKDVKIVRSSGFTDLDREALRAIARYRYVAGQEGLTSHPVIFNLKGQAAPAPSRLRTAGQTRSDD